MSLGNEVKGGLASLLLLLCDLESLFSHGRDSLFADVVSLGRAEPVVPLHSVPKSTTIFTSTVVVGLILVPVLVSEERTVSPHPLTFLEEVVSTNPNGGFGVNDSLDLVLFRSRSDGGKMSSPGSASFLSIGPVEFGVGDVLESSFGSFSFTDEFVLGSAFFIFPFSVASLESNTVFTSGGLHSLSEVGESELFVG